MFVCMHMSLYSRVLIEFSEMRCSEFRQSACIVSTISCSPLRKGARLSEETGSSQLFSFQKSHYRASYRGAFLWFPHRLFR